MTRRIVTLNLLGLTVTHSITKTQHKRITYHHADYCNPECRILYCYAQCSIFIVIFMYRYIAPFSKRRLNVGKTSVTEVFRRDWRRRRRRKFSAKERGSVEHKNRICDEIIVTEKGNVSVGQIELSNGNICLGLNYSVLNEMKWNK
jgi:hypothetical protein